MAVDLHCHIIPGIDDGAADVDTSLKMLRIAESDGTGHIIATPHFIHGAMNNHAGMIKERLELLQDLIRKEDLDIHIHPGSEVFICPEVLQLVQEGEICTLNDSSYILIELPMMTIPNYTREIIYQLKLMGYTPIIAHPERYMEISKDPNILFDFIQRGALAQVNATSITGIYGSKVREIAVTLLRHGMVHFVASDAHTCRGRSPKLSRAREWVRTEMGADAAEAVFESNGLAVLSNQEIKAAEPERVVKRKSFFVPLFRKIVSGFSHE